MRYYIYGEVCFSTTQKRTQAGRRLDQRASQVGFEPRAWQTFPAGRVDITRDGSPGLRFCYSTTDPDIAEAARADVAAAWDVLQSSDSFWSFTGVPE